MTAIVGEAPDRHWTGYTPAERETLAAEIGEITRALHRMPLEDLAAVEAVQGGAEVEIARQRAARIAEIEATLFTPWQRGQFLRFVTAEGDAFFGQPPVLTHADLSHAHLFVARQDGRPHVTGFIDWGGALIGPAEWDIVCHWFWTYSGDRPAMRACLKAYYGDRLPDRLARRCLATLFCTYSMSLLWPQFAEGSLETDDPLREMAARFFPPEVFGTPD
jgi:aminoglycoside phosphotransferase (APT) family kinase protein